MNWDKATEYIKENYTHPMAIVLGLILLTAVFVWIDDFLSKFITTPIHRFWLYLFLAVILISVWLYLRYHFPVNKRTKLGVLIAITSENKKQKIRIKNDFVKQLKELIQQNGLSDLINIIHLDQAKSKSFIRTISKKDSQKKAWQKISKKIKAHFYIYGDIKERMDGNNKYFLDLSSTIIHYPFNPLKKTAMSNSINEVWIKNHIIEENLEFKGFKITAELTFYGVRYIIGMAAFLSGDPYLALQLHENLYDDLESQKKLNKISPKFAFKLKSLISDECLVISRHQLESTKDYNSARAYLKKSTSFSNENYGGLLLKAILEYSLDKNPNKALKTIERAKAYCKGDATWKYSKAFLLFNLKKFQEGYSVYENIARNKFPMEIDRINQVIRFNEELLKSQPDHIQSIFIIGYLYLKKLENAPLALESLEKFLEKAKHKEDYFFLIDKAKQLLKETKQILEI
jgi:hypothetical protein